MKLNLLKYRTKLYLKKNRSRRSSLPYGSAKTAGIIFTVEDKQKHFAVKDFIKRLEGDGKHTQVLEFLPDHAENFEFKFDFFMAKDISFLGALQSENAIQFSEAPFDFLFYLDLTPNPMILHLLARSNAKCRVGGFWEDGDKYLDLMVNAVPNTPALLDALYKYVREIR
jgi:hypothetical protein